VRIGDEFRDQLVETGHALRLADLDAIAELGIKTVRYPIVWERVAPDHPDKLNFAWHDERLRRLRDLGITVIGGLVHHGSGPKYTSLLDPTSRPSSPPMPRTVAERYPWIDNVDPGQRAADHRPLLLHVRPLVPAPEGLPGLPQALVHECHGTLEAMRAIRRGQPGSGWSSPRTSARPSPPSEARLPGAPREPAPLAQPRPADREGRRHHPFWPMLTQAGCKARSAGRPRRAARPRPTSSASTITSPASATSTIGWSATRT
jgi:hypothetical protein